MQQATRLRKKPDPGTFLLLLVLLDVGLIPTGGGGIPLIFFFYGLALLANSLDSQKRSNPDERGEINHGGGGRLGVA